MTAQTRPSGTPFLQGCHHQRVWAEERGKSRKQKELIQETPPGQTLCKNSKQEQVQISWGLNVTQFRGGGGVGRSLRKKAPKAKYKLGMTMRIYL